MTPIVVGIAIAQEDVVVACRPEGPPWTATNEAAGIHATLTRLRTLRPPRIVVEATGGDETALVAALAAAGLPLVVANPRPVRDFAKATGPLAKTDRLDAAIVARVADRVQPTPRPLREPVLPPLTARMTLRGKRVVWGGRAPLRAVLGLPLSLPQRRRRPIRRVRRERGSSDSQPIAL